MKQFIQFGRFLIFSNLLIAFAAIAQIVLTYLILRISLNMYVVLLEGGATLLLYNFSLWLSMPSRQNDSPFLRTQWFFNHQFHFWFLSLLACLLILYSLLYLHVCTFLFLGCVGLLSLGYAVPIFRFQGRFITLRQIVGVKVFLIALVWTMSVVGMPIVEFLSSGGTVVWAKVFVWALLVMLFVLGITLPFDIRDMKQDQYYNLKTIPIIIGKNKAIGLCYFLILAHSLLLFLLIQNATIAIGLLCVDLFVILVFTFVLFKKQMNYQAVYLLDLVLIIQLLIVWVLVKIF